VKIVGSGGLSNMVKISEFRHLSLFSSSGEGGEVFEVINSENKKRANLNHLIVRQV
jgi:hypothetical protein